MRKGGSRLNRLVYERFGSRSGFVLFLGYWFLANIGGFRQFPPVRPQQNQRLVFVCNGNICRSPLAEVYARSLGREAASCGLNCGDGNPADPRAKDFAKQYQLDLEHHRTTNAKSFSFRPDDLVVVMEPSHIASFQRIVGDHHHIVLAGSFCQRPRPYIHDPYNCCTGFFENCERQVLEAVRGVCA
ncbi:hypothetical protein [Marinobacter sediminum]|uniref:arsenate reductase/protein-tyrosine-phosphatase family protein n=1 Tax=Marinobacter sediminum TaxID=256323 RepID=UPI003B84B36B